MARFRVGNAPSGFTLKLCDSLSTLLLRSWLQFIAILAVLGWLELTPLAAALPKAANGEEHLECCGLGPPLVQTLWHSLCQCNEKRFEQTQLEHCCDRGTRNTD